MREPGSILLISCYELGHQPLGLASPAAFLQRAGFRPALLDLSIESLDRSSIERARMIGISVPMHTAIRIGVEAARRIREVNPGCHLIYYGLYASLNADYLRRDGQADAIVGGEYEEALVDIARWLESPARPSGDTPTRERPGIDPIVRTPLERLAFPAPTRDALPTLGRYARLQRNGTLTEVGYVEASRGCLHACRHCPIPPVYGGRFFVLPRAVVLADIDRQVEAGAGHITFGDPDFLNGPGHAMAIVRELHARHPRVSFDVTCKVEHVLKHAALFPELARCGCLFVVSAVESLSDQVLERLHKGHTRAGVETALTITRDAGIALRPTFVAFTPWTTGDDYLELLDFVEREQLIDHVDPVQYGLRLLLPPGSLLLEEPSLQPCLGELDQPNFVVRWTHPDARMDALQGELSAALETAARAKADPMATYYRLRDLAHRRLRSRGVAAPEFPPLAERTPAPRLTEDWFC